MRVSQPVVDRAPLRPHDPVLWRQAFRPSWKLRENQAPAQGIEHRRFEMPLEEVLRTAHFFEKWRVLKALVDAQRERVLGLTAFGAAGGDISAVKTAKLRSCTGAARRGTDRPHAQEERSRWFRPLLP